ncbi:MAG TPA: YsnF/AvaK domain-containing protein, partial [Pseudonocardiaceae bacterium]|nr:YsnF/AvaK domain-containing protein [Pseudonocardiaceae bacterium]
DTSGPNTDEAMTRSEERLHVGTESRVAGKARLRKHIVTENVSTTVPVRHEEVTVEREPITEANRADAMSGGELTEEEHEVTLHEERVVTAKEAVPVERVRLGTETVTEHAHVDDTVRKEQIESDIGGAEDDPNSGRH